MFLDWTDLSDDLSAMTIREKEGFRPKNRRPMDYPVPPMVKKILERTPPDQRTGPVFRNRNGRRHVMGTLTHAYRKIFDRAGIPDASFHHTRHTSGTTQSTGGTPPSTSCGS